jgi:hypothetical protein
VHRRHVLLYASFTGSGKCVGMSHIWLVLAISWWQCWWGYDLGTQGHKCTILKVWDILGQGWEGSECGFEGRHTWGEQVNIAKVAKEQAAASSKDELLCAGISFPTNICSWESVRHTHEANHCQLHSEAQNKLKENAMISVFKVLIHRWNSFSNMSIDWKKLKQSTKQLKNSTIQECRECFIMVSRVH